MSQMAGDDYEVGSNVDSAGAGSAPQLRQQSVSGREDMRTACTVVINRENSNARGGADGSGTRGLEVNRTIVGSIFTIERVNSNRIRLPSEDEEQKSHSLK